MKYHYFQETMNDGRGFKWSSPPVTVDQAWRPQPVMQLLMNHCLSSMLRLGYQMNSHHYKETMNDGYVSKARPRRVMVDEASRPQPMIQLLMNHCLSSMLRLGYHAVIDAPAWLPATP
jgi:hypothetical protein